MTHLIEHLPVKESPFIWSDFVELYTLSVANGHCDEQEFIKLIQNHKTGKDIYSIENIQSLWQKLIQHCFERAALYDSHYPFVVQPDKKTITLKFIKTHPKQRLYISMVLISSMRYLPEEWHSEMARDFSETCKLIFSCLMPEGSQLEHITTGLNTPLTTEKIQSLVRLACGESIAEKDKLIRTPKLESQPSPAQNDQNTPFLMDMLAWHPIGDGLDGIPVAIARFDCGMGNWQQGQQQLFTLNELLYTGQVPWAAYHFSPIDIYTAKQDWKHQILPRRMILLDRYRILTLAENFFVYNDIPDVNHIELLYQHIEEQINL